MALTLAIDNLTRLPDGGPVSIQITGKRGIDIGRDSHLDWTLPDPDRFISGKHCEIRYRDGGYWLHDVSSNGTFVNGNERRLHEPHRLRNGDRIEIGHYLISVTLDTDEPEPVAAEPAPRRADPGELWGVSGDVAPPLAAAELQLPRRAASAPPDFLEWAVDVPDAQSLEPVFKPMPPLSGEPQQPRTQAFAKPQPRQPGPDPDASWAGELPPSPFSDLPTPARPAPQRVWSSEENVWQRPPSREPSAETIPAPAQPAEDLPVGSAGEEVGPALPAAPPRPELQAAPVADGQDFLRRLALGAGVPEATFVGRDAGAVAEEVGALLQLIAENLKQLLGARAESRGLVRSSRQTMIQALDNNPLKFSPTAEDALRIMLGPPSKSYLDARQTLSQTFDDLKSHQLNTYAAMQQALKMLVEELDPQSIERATEPDRGLGAVVGSRRARLWDAYVALWEAKASRHDNGLLDAFMLYFSECYQRNASKIR
jgi:type VI secretion system protein ImpI